MAFKRKRRHIHKKGGILDDNMNQARAVKCRLCQKVVVNQKDVMEHHARKHSQNLCRTCQYCGRKFRTFQLRETHLQNSHKGRSDPFNYPRAIHLRNTVLMYCFPTEELLAKLKQFREQLEKDQSTPTLGNDLVSTSTVQIN